MLDVSSIDMHICQHGPLCCANDSVISCTHVPPSSLGERPPRRLPHAHSMARVSHGATSTDMLRLSKIKSGTVKCRNLPRSAASCTSSARCNSTFDAPMSAQVRQVLTQRSVGFNEHSALVRSQIVLVIGSIMRNGLSATGLYDPLENGSTTGEPRPQTGQGAARRAGDSKCDNSPCSCDLDLRILPQFERLGDALVNEVLPLLPYVIDLFFAKKARQSISCISALYCCRRSQRCRCCFISFVFTERSASSC